MSTVLMAAAFGHLFFFFAMASKTTRMGPPRPIKKKPPATCKSTGRKPWKPHPMYVQMALLKRMPTERLQKHIHYLFECVPGLN